MLSSQADPPTIKHIDFSLDIQLFVKKQSFRSDDGLESFWGLSWRHFGCSWGLLGGSVGALGGFLGAPGGIATTLTMILEPP